MLTWVLYFALGSEVTTTLAQADVTLPAGADLSATTKIVRKYALTSANDFPQRDPQDWRLLASNDEGKTWAILDIRKGEFFSERHQRRVFACTNNMAYNMYRLQIDRVRDSNAADAVQLSQIEPMGKSEDDLSPSPLFCDLITAQGGNPPIETASEAFDGKVETKWLDRAGQHPATRSSWIQWQYVSHASLVITNLNQLLSLRNRAIEGFPVQIICVLVGKVSGTNGLIFLDSSGYIEVRSTDQVPKLTPGQQVLLSGVSYWNDDQVEIHQLHVQKLEPEAPDGPKWIKNGLTFTDGKNLQWIEVEGQLQFLTKSDHGLVFTLTENGQSVPVHILHFSQTQVPHLSGAHVRVSGLCMEALDENGNHVLGTLLVPNLSAVSIIDESDSVDNLDSNARQNDFTKIDGALFTKIIQIRQLTRNALTNAPKVKVRGVVTEPSGTYIQDETGGVEIWPENLTELQMPGLGAYVEIEGRAISSTGHGVAGYGPAILADKVHYLGNGKLPDPIRPSWSLLTSGQTDAEWIEVHGVVRATDGSHLLLACENGELMATIVSASVLDVNHLVDATVKLRGVSVVATDERGQMQGVQLVVPSLEFVEVQQPALDIISLPAISIGSLLQIRGPKELIHRVKIIGIVTGFANNNYFIQDDSGSVRVIAKQEVTLSLPPGGWWSFWQSPKTNVHSFVETNLKVGDRVEVLGFPESHDYASVLTKASIRVIGPVSQAVAVKTTAAELAKGGLDSTLVTLDGQILGSQTWGAFSILQIQSGQKVFQAFLPLNGDDSPEIDPGSRVRITGICQMEPVVHGELGKSPSAFSLLLRDASDIYFLKLPPWLTAKRALVALGSLIMILCCAFVWIRLLHQQVETRTRQLRNEIAEHEKTEGLLDRKTQLLQREIQEHEKTEARLAEKTELLEREINERESLYVELKEKKISLELKIEERNRIQMEIEKIHRQLLKTSRLAGMADLATNVLHNVGNVLNGVNVLATSIASFVQKSKAPGVSRLATLLAQHQADLGTFITNDENGKHIPQHLKRLGAHLTDEHYKLVEKTKLLAESVQHIKEIVAMQQNYAKVSGVWETVLISEIVEDALKMCSEAFERHGINIVREYQETPYVILDRHKVLQILFNLIDNAKHACEAIEKVEKQVRIKIHASRKESVQVEIVDSGVGISKENLSRVFTQGFSTRKDGHGFGLHSSILAAQDMGGSLTVQSQGLGTGAVFILELPLMLNKASEKTRETTGILTG
jgi:signal transduction histidine kinase